MSTAADTLVCPNCGGTDLIVKDRPGCHEGADCTHICPDCAWHFTEVEDES